MPKQSPILNGLDKPFHAALNEDRLLVQNRAIAHPGQELAFGGVVTGKREGRLVGPYIFWQRGDNVMMPGTAAVAQPLRSAT